MPNSVSHSWAATGLVLGVACGQLLAQATFTLTTRARSWTNQGEDDNSIHAMGNGHLVALSAGPGLSCFFGPPYTSPNLLQLCTTSPRALQDKARRELGAAIWHHELTVDGQPALRFIEFAASTEPAYVRQFECLGPGVSWRMRPHPAGGFKPAGNIPGSWMQCVRPGQPIYRDAKITDQWSWTWIVPRGSCHAELSERGELTIRLEPGSGSLVIVGASDYPSGVLATERVVRQSTESLLSPTRRFWDHAARRIMPRGCSEPLSLLGPSWFLRGIIRGCSQIPEELQ